MVLLAGTLAADDWSTFEPASRVGRVSLPDRPDETASRSVTNATGRVELTTAQVRTADGVYSVRITETDAHVDPKTLDDGIRQYAAAKKGTLGPLRSITVDGNPGREFELTAGSGRSKVRFVITGGALFVLSAGGLAGASVPADADRFLGSLRIGAPVPPEANADKAGSN